MNDKKKIPQWRQRYIDSYNQVADSLLIELEKLQKFLIQSLNDWDGLFHICYYGFEYKSAKFIKLLHHYQNFRQWAEMLKERDSLWFRYTCPHDFDALAKEYGDDVKEWGCNCHAPFIDCTPDGQDVSSEKCINCGTMAHLP